MKEALTRGYSHCGDQILQLLYSILIFGMLTNGYAQEQVPSPVDEQNGRIQDFLDKNPVPVVPNDFRASSQTRVSTPNISTCPSEPKIQAACYEAARRYYLSLYENLDQRKKVLERHHERSRVIFWMVLALVVSGIIFSAMQFYSGLRSATTETTKLAIRAKGVEVTTPVVGVVILVLSLGFFYLYLLYVYPITEIAPS